MTPLYTVVNHQCVLGEGVIWDEKQKMVAWVDIEKGEIHEFSPGEKSHHIIPVSQRIGTISFCSDGNYIAGLQSGIGIIDRNTHEVKIIDDPEADIPGNRFNDGKCDPAGRFWAGTLAIDEEPDKGSLYALGEGWLVKKKIGKVSVSNGMAWDTRKHLFYYIDSPTHTIAAYDYDRSTGRISNKRIVLEIVEEEGAPDGMCIDREGMLWIAHWGGWKVTRWNPGNAMKLCEIKLPVAQVTSCAFGGEDMSGLFITTAKIGLGKEELARQPLAGSLFVIDNCGYTGLPAFRFKEWT